jgi:hypothetical protein
MGLCYSKNNKEITHQKKNIFNTSQSEILEYNRFNFDKNVQELNNLSKINEEKIISIIKHHKLKHT